MERLQDVDIGLQHRQPPRRVGIAALVERVEPGIARKEVEEDRLPYVRGDRDPVRPGDAAQVAVHVPVLRRDPDGVEALLGDDLAMRQATRQRLEIHHHRIARHVRDELGATTAQPTHQLRLAATADFDKDIERFAGIFGRQGRHAGPCRERMWPCLTRAIDHRDERDIGQPAHQHRQQYRILVDPRGPEQVRQVVKRSRQGNTDAETGHDGRRFLGHAKSLDMRKARPGKPGGLCLSGDGQAVTI